MRDVGGQIWNLWDRARTKLMERLGEVMPGQWDKRPAEHSKGTNVGTTLSQSVTQVERKWHLNCSWRMAKDFPIIRQKEFIAPWMRNAKNHFGQKIAMWNIPWNWSRVHGDGTGSQTIPENVVPEGEELERDFRDNGKPVKILSRNRVWSELLFWMGWFCSLTGN